MKIQYTHVILILFISILFIITPKAISETKKSKLILNDPTRPDVVKFKQKKSKSVKSRKKISSKLSLQQTLISQFKKIAIINGVALTIGKKIRGAELIEIGNDHVVLQREGNLYQLNLTFPPIIKEISGN